MIPKTDPESTELDSNLAVVCANCHRQIHALEIIIEGYFPTSGGKRLFWHKAGSEYQIRPGIILHSNGTASIVEA
jgi:hypothetical protein